MGWKDLRSKSNPVKRHEQALKEEEQAIADRLEQIKHQIDQIKNPPPPPPRETVWHSPETSDAVRVRIEASRRGHRTHGAQRRRDRTRFIVLACCFLILVIWLVRLF